MPKKLECPLDGCHATIEAETEEEVLSQAEKHAESEHPELEVDDETVEDLRSRIQDVQ